LTSKYKGEIEHYLGNLKSYTGSNLRISNDGDRHFIIDDKGHSFGHGQSYSNLYSSIYFCSEILSHIEKTKKIPHSKECIKKNEIEYDIANRECICEDEEK
jgi:hypothetical protein